METKKPNRLRNKRIVVDVTDEEREAILANMEKMGIKNIGAYARKMLIDGCVINVDYTAIKELTTTVGKYGNNVNQIARRANETRRVNDTDIEEVKKTQKQIVKALRKIAESLT